MNRTALKMISLAAISSMSAAAMAITVTAPQIKLNAPVVTVPTNVAPSAAPKAALPGTEQAKQVAPEAAGQTCDPKAMYASMAAGTEVLPEEVQELVNANVIQVAMNDCGQDNAKMSATARNVWLKSARCGLTKGIKQVGDYNTRVQILGGCMEGVKRELGMTDVTTASAANDVEETARKCQLFKLAM